MTEIKVTKKLEEMAEMLLDGIAERVIYAPDLPANAPFRPDTAKNGRVLVVELPTVTVDGVPLNGIAASYRLRYSQINRFIDITVSPFFRPDWRSVSGYFHPHIGGNGRMCGDEARRDAYNELRLNGVDASVRATYANMHMIKDHYLDRDDWHWFYFKMVRDLEPGNVDYDTAIVWILTRSKYLGSVIPMVFTEEYLRDTREAIDRLEEKGIRSLPYGHRWYNVTWDGIKKMVDKSIDEIETADSRWESLLERSYIWQK